jgi:enoyl-CoA hydratase/carnithine racemase
MSSEPVLHRRRQGNVEIVTINRPERRNALNQELIEAFDATFAELASDDGARAIVLTGTGDRAFCAGMDLKEFASGSADSPVTQMQTDGVSTEPVEKQSTVIRWDYPKPIVAAVNGAAVAGGFELMLCCDLVVAAEHATFGLAEAKRGLLPGAGGTLLATRIPLALALELTLTGEMFDAERAFDIGLVNRVVPREHVLEAALAYAAAIANNGPLAVTVIKQLVRRGATDGGQAAWPTPAQFAQVFGSQDAKEGALAFVEKRTPKWVGR